MKLFLVVLCAAVATAAEVPQLYYHESVGIPLAAQIKLSEENATIGERIVGGTPAGLGGYPYMGGLLITLSSGATSVCGSSLLTNTRLITAAQCWWDGRNRGQQLTVVLGSTLLFSGGVRIITNDVQLHNNWNPVNLFNNIAMITITHVNFNSVIQPVVLPSDVNLGANNFARWWGVIVGYGRTSDSSGIATNQFLSRTNVEIITNEECERSLGSVLVMSSRICTSGASGAPCGGDAGGPLVVITNSYGPVLVGMTSSSLWGCESVMPSVYIRITSFESWIRNRL